jgi:L-iditol 2-dehydrogenase
LCDTLHRTDFDPGGFAEYVRLTPIHVDRGVFRLPPDVSDEDAVFVEPLACVLRAQRRAGLRRAQSVLVVGSGIAGLLHVKLARASGAGLILAADINEFRLQTARRFGADAALAAEGDLSVLVRQANDGELADLVIVCTSAGSAIAKALAAVSPGGTLLFFAPATPELMLPMRFNDVFWRTDLTLTTSYGASPADYAAALALIHHRRVQMQDMVTHRLGLSQAGLGFQLVAEAKESIKVVLDHDR